VKALLIDNHDSFTWNLAQQIRSLGTQCDVVRNDALAVKDIEHIGPDCIILSPGPGSPKDARVSNDVLRSVASGELQIPVLGVCLGHQCMGTIFGGEKNVGRAPKAMHGKTSKIFHAGKSVFDGIPSPFLAARYHSLVVKKLPKDFELLAWTEDKVIMGMKHKILPLVGVQFHPESFLTEHGDRVLFHFLSGQW
jgi:anthranilate synthase/aminodeoxychorismate synthase-like glutamine amidotransferase